jgi:hypothetical protein
VAEGTGVGLGAAGEPPPPQAPSDAATAAAITATTAERVALRTIVTSLRLFTGSLKQGILPARPAGINDFQAFFASLVAAARLRSAMSGRVTALLAVLAAAVSACGSGSPTRPTPTPTPTPPPTRTVLATQSFTLAPGATFTDTVDNVPAGTVDARAEWPGGSDLNLYVTDTSCPGVVQLAAGSCRVFAQAVGSDRPERVQFAAPGTANYSVWVRNVGTAAEPVTLEFAVTR